MSRAGGPGSAARWAVKTYRILRAEHPNPSEFSDMDVFRMMIALRYSVIPSPRATAYLEGCMSVGDIGLRSLVEFILQADNSVNDLPPVFKEAIDEELAKSGLPESVISGPPLSAARLKQLCERLAWEN